MSLEGTGVSDMDPLSEKEKENNDMRGKLSKNREKSSSADDDYSGIRSQHEELNQVN